MDYRCDNRRVIVRKNEIDRIAEGNPYHKHQALFEKGFNAKGSDWAYEKEYRHFVRLDYCEKADGLYFKPSHRGRIRNVVLGARSTVTEEDVWRAFDDRGGRHEHFQILLAKPDQEQLKMKIVPYDVQPNKSWFWQPSRATQGKLR